MRKVILVMLVTISTASCKKESGCGKCVGTGEVDCTYSPCTYTLPVQFDDGHFSNVSVSEDTWLHTLEGERVCF